MYTGACFMYIYVVKGILSLVKSQPGRALFGVTLLQISRCR
jgi:hypothetical protein